MQCLLPSPCGGLRCSSVPAISLWRSEVFWCSCHLPVAVWGVLVFLPAPCGGLKCSGVPAISLWRSEVFWCSCHLPVAVWSVLVFLPSPCGGLKCSGVPAISLWRSEVFWWVLPSPCGGLKCSGVCSPSVSVDPPPDTYSVVHCRLALTIDVWPVIQCPVIQWPVTQWPVIQWSVMFCRSVPEVRHRQYRPERRDAGDAHHLPLHVSVSHPYHHPYHHTMYRWVTHTITHTIIPCTGESPIPSPIPSYHVSVSHPPIPADHRLGHRLETSHLSNGVWIQFLPMLTTGSALVGQKKRVRQLLTRAAARSSSWRHDSLGSDPADTRVCGGITRSQHKTPTYRAKQCYLTIARIRCFATFARTGGGLVRPPLAFPNEASCSFAEKTSRLLSPSTCDWWYYFWS